MTADSLIEVVLRAIDITGMSKVPVKDRTSLLLDNGSGHVSRAFDDYLRLVGIEHILASPLHPQTNGKVARYQLTLKKATIHTRREYNRSLRKLDNTNSDS